MSTAPGPTDPPSAGQPAGYLVGAVTVLTGLLAALQVTNDVLEKMLRDHLVGSILAFSAAVGAFVLGALALTWPKSSRRHLTLTRWGLGALLVALLAGIYSGARTWGDRERPVVSATVKYGGRSPVLHVSVADQGLSSRDHMTVLVQPSERGGARRVGVLDSAEFGPDSHGVVNRAFDVTLPPADWSEVEIRAWVGDIPDDCYGSLNTTGCQIVHIERSPERPQLDVTWAAGRHVRIHIHTANVPGASVAVRVVETKPTRVVLAEWWLAPDAYGAFDRTLTLAIPKRVGEICVVGSTFARHPACPAGDHANKDSVWVRLLSATA